jgi:hypothetical protein
MSSLAGAALFAAPYIMRSQDAPRKLNIAVIGAGGKGSSDTDHVSSENIVALCDADKRTLDSRKQKYPGAELFQDYRKMYDKIGKSIDAVVISAPDHHHGIATAMAMKMKKHVYTQKPLTQTVEEARILNAMAKKYGVVTQMGNQGSSEDGLRRAVEVLQSGIIGNMTELHVWSNRPIWPQGIPRPEGEDPVPAELDWDVWVGPAKMRPYKKDVYHPFKWRGWYDYGTGALGDMACHTVNMPSRALKLGYPSLIECEEVKDLQPETYPKSSRIRFEFPARDGMPPLKFWWYDGNPKDKTCAPLRPGAELTKEILEQRGELPGSGCLIVGDKGKLFSPDDYGAQFFLAMKGEKEFKDGKAHDAVKNIPQTIPRNPFKDGGGDKAHHVEWLAAIKGQLPDAKKPYSTFETAAFLTEIILLGCVALRHGVGQKIEWDGPKAKAKNANVKHLTNREYRKGWKMP